MSKVWVEDTWRGADGRATNRMGKGQRWRVYWWEEARSDPQGRTRRRRSERFARKVDADKRASALENGLRSGVHRPRELGDARFADVAREWLASRLDIKPSTQRRYSRELRTYVLPEWGHRKVGTITKAEVAEWVAQLSSGRAQARYKARGTAVDETTPTTTMTRPLSPASVRHLHTVLSAILSWAIETDRITRNPAQRVRLPRPRAQEHVYLSHSQVEALATAAHGVTGDESDRVLVHLLAYTGMRINEALALRVESLDLLRARARVAETWTVDTEGRRILGPPKTHQSRSVPLPRFVVDELMTLTAGRASHEFVFQAPRGGPVNDHNWRTRVFTPALSDADLTGLGATPHKLRHTAASAAIAAGADVKVVQLMLGHKDATETLNTYGHLWPDRLDEVSAALEGARSAELSPPTAAVAHVPRMSPRAS